MSMSSQLVPVFTGEIQNESVQLCEARKLHGFLEVGKVFATWITERIQSYNFIEGEDFVLCFPNLGSKGKGGHNRKEYHITLDMAKELAMVENNDKGRQARRYFIEVEKRASKVNSRRLPSASQQLAAHNSRLKLLDRLEAERNPEKRDAIYQQLDQVSRMLNVPTPDIDKLGYAHVEPDVDPLVGEFWDAVEYIGLDKLDHSKDEGFIALNLPHLAKVAAKAKVSMPSLSACRRVLAGSKEPKFMASNQVVRSKLEDRAMRCWIFRVLAIH